MDKQQEILAAALKLFVEYGFHGTPTSKIAQEAGVANGTLFHYYKTKDELVVALYNRIKADLNGFLQTKISPSDSSKAKLRSMFVHSVKWTLANKSAFYFIQQFHFSPHLSLVSPHEIETQNQMHIRLLQEAMDSNIIKARPIPLLYALISSQIFGIHQYLVTAALPSILEDQVIEDSFEMMYRMLES